MLDCKIFKRLSVRYKNNKSRNEHQIDLYNLGDDLNEQCLCPVLSYSVFFLQLSSFWEFLVLAFSKCDYTFCIMICSFDKSLNTFSHLLFSLFVFWWLSVIKNKQTYYPISNHNPKLKAHSYIKILVKH